MLLNLLVLSLAAVAWIAALWLPFQTDFANWSYAGAAALHAAPPLGAWLLWLGLRFRSHKAKAIDELNTEQNAQAERDAELEAARARHAQELAQRRFSCDCRAVAIAGLRGMREPPLLDAQVPQVEIVHPVSSEAESIMDRLAPLIDQALSSVYCAARASLRFPIFIVPPLNASGEDAVVRIRAIHAQLSERHDPQAKRGNNIPSVLFLPTADCTANSAISLFESTPDLPGAIVLAFDSSLSRAPKDEMPEDTAHVQRFGQPDEAAIALLLTNSELTSMLAATAYVDTADQEDSMTPFWNRGLQLDGHLALLARANKEARDELACMSVLGRIHRAVFREAASPRDGVLGMTRRVKDALESAFVNAGMIEPAFEHGSALADAPAPPHCSHIAHNAGSIEVGGHRLAALSSALYDFDIDLSPVDAATATNFIAQAGDLGKATGVGLLAIGVAQAARKAAPAMCAEFSGDGIAVSFVMPATE